MLLVSCAKSSRIPGPDYIPGPEGEYITASWYGEQFHGRPTSSGERYDMYGLSAAHKTMKFGTRLRVTNPDTEKSVVLIVNDRGPFIDGRDLDLSYGAANEIGFAAKGVGRIKIEYLGRDIRYAKRVPFVPTDITGILTIQVGSFTEQANAARLKQGLDIAYSDVYITTVQLQGREFHRVRIGKFSDRDNAYMVAKKLADEGYTTLITSRN